MDEQQAKEWDAFLAAHVRYEDTSENWNCISAFLQRFDLDFTSDNLHRAFTVLRDELQLIPLATPIVERPPASAPQSQTPSQPEQQRRAFPATNFAFRNGRPISIDGARRL
jgi:hypothetical protein